MTLVHHILESAQRRLAVLRREASIADAANILADPNTPLVVVCDEDDIAVGVISRMDVVRLFSRAGEDAHKATAGEIMTSPFLSCRTDQGLQSVWDALSPRGLRCAPVLDDSGRPRGVLHARELVRALLDEVTHEEILLRDYVLGVGYR